MIIATAGHVDHGKTSLVRHLTGVDTDRLEEEKRRGLSINLGYAYIPVETGVPVGFIDVPGHQRFINTMISGVSGIDLGLLVIAADDGVMPQTQEHLDVLAVLGVRRLVLAVSKVDKVEPERVAQVTAAADGLLANQGFERLNTFAVSNLTGEGTGALKAFLLDAASECNERVGAGCFRLSIDRAFNVKGSGLVVTGTTATGTVSQGDTLLHFPSSEPVRVRALRVHDKEAHSALPGQRCAINLSGSIALEDVHRGDFLLSPECAEPSQIIDADVTMLAGASFPLKHLSPVKVHIGARRVAGRIALPETKNHKRLQPGDDGAAQLRLDEPVPSYTCQRFVLRDHAENVTLGGGVVIDPCAKARRRTDERTAKRLAALKERDTAAGLNSLVADSGIAELSSFVQAHNLSATEQALLIEQFEIDPATCVFRRDNRVMLASTALLESLHNRLITELKRVHASNPREPGIKASALTQSWNDQFEVPALTEVIKQALQAGSVSLKEGYLLLAGFKPARASEQEKAWAAYEQYLRQRGTHIALLSETAEETKLPLKLLRSAATLAVREGRAFAVSERRFALPEHLLSLSEGVLKLSHTGEEITVIALKREWSLGRNIVIEILEFFDSVRFTVRKGNARAVLDEALPQKLFGAAKK